MPKKTALSTFSWRCTLKLWKRCQPCSKGELGGPKRQGFRRFSYKFSITAVSGVLTTSGYAWIFMLKISMGASFRRTVYKKIMFTFVQSWQVCLFLLLRILEFWRWWICRMLLLLELGFWSISWVHVLGKSVYYLFNFFMTKSCYNNSN